MKPGDLVVDKWWPTLLMVKEVFTSEYGVEHFTAEHVAGMPTYNGSIRIPDGSAARSEYFTDISNVRRVVQGDTVFLMWGDNTWLARRYTFDDNSNVIAQFLSSRDFGDDFTFDDPIYHEFAISFFNAVLRELSKRG